ncbi:hypothetical protein JYU10_00520, partial [bacterium AH-315-J04]|nr:hypothetical protein [bacterium AH-315-J04]
SLLVAMGMTASLFAGERSTETSRDQKRVLKEENLSKQLEIEEIVEFVLPTISDYVTEDGKLVIAGVTSVKRDEQGRTIVEIKYNGDFEEDWVLTIPRPVLYDEQGELIGIQGPDSIQVLSDRAVYVFDAVTVRKEYSRKAGPTPSVSSFAQDNCELFIDIDNNGKSCEMVGDGCPPLRPVCIYAISDSGKLTCDCEKEEATP